MQVQGEAWFGVLGCVLFMAIGFALLIIPPRLMARSRSKREDRCCCRAYGIVDDLDYESTVDSDGHRHKAYFPVVRFDYNGRSYSFRHNMGSSPAQYEIGEQVEIRFEPDDPSGGYHILPKDANIDRAGRIIFSVLGILFVVVPCVALVAMFLG